ncbi:MULTISPECIES: S-layer homology domain-containing protein [unclassified Fusibacter]|uniref:S-layer homology domain-containing protein n=1 Tax=unclassified Fusibacter TaxID=2624464 RepID=UPI001010F09A|nr:MULTISPECIES: S-layer homology domain-containing protein [unclassified Fusibacter]MCK8060412.1 S-layer homology domain-containing protein [Fusibacter sp. A2]NPE20299.1 S-layer homology domain-containing protein [Fusibacter sp. A1]RXV63505.1 S-layer homology domain-containing protein [Fusibacter sp. A1]
MKHFSFIAILTILLLFTFTFADDFTIIEDLPIDPDDDLPEFMIIEELRIPVGSIDFGAGYVIGYPDNTFKPDKQITYAEFSSMIARAIGINGSAAVNSTCVTPDHWAYESLSAVEYYHILSHVEIPDATLPKLAAENTLLRTADFLGIDVDFRPFLEKMHSEITRAEAVALVNHLLSIQDNYFKLVQFSDVAVDHPYYFTIAASTE